MDEFVQDIISASSEDKPLDVAKAFDSTMKTRIAAALEAKRPDILSAVFNKGSEE